MLEDKLNIKKIVSSVIVGGMIIISIPGCGQDAPEVPVVVVESLDDVEVKGNNVGAKAQEETTAASEIELVEPKGTATLYDYASYRNIYDYDVYSCMVIPSITEYLYTADESFGYYGVLPGDSVSKNDVLIYADMGNLFDDIETKEEAIDKKARDYIENLTELYEDLYEAKKNEYTASVAYFDMVSVQPEEGTDAYNLWAKRALPLEGGYKSAEQNRKKIEQRIKEAEELYALENEYDLGVVERLRKKAGQTTIHSNDEGIIVAANPYVEGDIIQKNSEIIAIGNTEDKIFLTEYISAGVISKAEDVYAFVDGKRYEVSYIPMENDEYTRLKKKNGAVYSSFYIEDPENELVMGTFGDIVVANKSAKNILTVPNDAVFKDGSESFVYLFDGENSTSVKVETGIRDGMYTEILSGIKKDDMVLTENVPVVLDNTKTLEKGDISSDFKQAGYLFYPSSKWVTNPAKIGTCYIKEICVEQYEHVTKGQVLAKVEVIADDVAIKRVERKILRNQQRLVKLYEKREKKVSEETDKSLERAIRQRERTIEELSKELSKLKQYMGVINLTAECDGIITEKTKLKDGELIGYKERLVRLADSSDCYIAVEDSENRLSLGNKVTVSYKDNEGSEIEVEGEVTTVTENALSKELKTGYTLIRLPEEESIKMAALGSSKGEEGRWNRSRFSVSATIRDVENVVLVPKNAVTEKSGYTYVKTVSEKGIGTYVAFVAGGSDLTNYWVVEGLSEGTKICLE